MNEDLCLTRYLNSHMTQINNGITYNNDDTYLLSRSSSDLLDLKLLLLLLYVLNYLKNYQCNASELNWQCLCSVMP